MKKNIIGIYVIVFVLSLFGGSNVVFAITPTFQTEAEINAYYDAQHLKNKENYEQKVQSIKDQLEITLDSNHKYFEAERLKVYRSVFGESFETEMIKTYLPANNPDPEAIYLDTLHFPENKGISKQYMILFVNPDLYKKLVIIHERESSNLNKKIDILNQKISDYNSLPKIETKIIKKEEIKKVIEPIKNIPVISSSDAENKETIKTEVDNKNIINPEPVIKVRWYNKIINWLRGK